jgi:CRP-like cAMP-binding protein
VQNEGLGIFFGEGALLHPKKIRSATIKCVTPDHAMEISRQFFDKYLASSDSGLFLTLREKDKIRKRNRAKTNLWLQENLVERQYKKGERLFDVGEDGDSLFIVERGKMDICNCWQQSRFDKYTGQCVR